MPIIIGIILLVVIIALIVMAISWIFSNFLGVFGIVAAIAGLYYVGKYAKEGKKSKTPGILIVLGVLLAFGWFSLSGDDNDVAKTKETSGQVSGVVSKKENKDSTSDQAEKQAKKQEEEQKAKEEAEQKAQEEVEKQVAEKEKAQQEAEAKAKAEEEAKKQQEELAASLALEAVTVSRVVDGDTVELSDGRKVRLVGVNTPESTNRTEEYGKEASDYTTSKLEGKQVWLQKDVSDTDRYQRYLRIIWLAIPTDVMNESEIRSKMFNADLVLNGYAEPSTYPPDVKYSDYFVKFAREARENNTGLWAFGENGTTKGDLDPKETAAKSNTSTAKTNTTTPKVSAPTTKPTTPSAPPASTPPASTGGSESYKNCTELRKVHPQGVGQDHPAYAPKHDRDKDGWACEVS